MKQAIIALSAFTFLLGSCSKLDLGKHGGDKAKKETITSEQTINVKAGETISIALPTEQAHDGYAVINQSAIATSSTVVDYTNYSYTAPAILPSGIVSDDIMVSNDHHVYAIGHIEIPNATCVKGGPQHYTVNVHVKFVDAQGKPLAK